MSRRIALLGAAASTALWAAAPPAWAAEVSIVHSAETLVTYTDNVDLDPDDEAEDAIIWTNTGATSIRAAGARVQAALDAALSLDTEFNEGTDVDLRPHVRGIGTVELLEDRFFVDGHASAVMVLEDPTSPISASPSSGRDDQAAVYTIGISPYLVQRFGNWASSELRYRHDRVFVDGSGDDDDGIEDTIVNEVGLQTTTGSRFTRIVVRNDLEYLNVNSDDGGDLERATALLDGQYVLIRQLSLVGSIGYETIDSDDLRDDPEGVIWNAGFLARPGPRSEFEFRYGERYEETNIFASALYRVTPRLTFQANYTEILDITTARLARENINIIIDEQGRLIDPRTGLPVDLTDEEFGLEDEAFLAERLQASLTGDYGRYDFVLLTTYEQRNFDFQPDEELFTASGQVNYALTPDTRLGTFAAYRTADEDAPGATDTETVLARIQITHDLAENFQALAAYSYTERFADSNDDEYTENAVTLGLRVTF